MIVQAQGTPRPASTFVEHAIIFVDSLNFIKQHSPNTAIDDSYQYGRIGDCPIRKGTETLREILLAVHTGSPFVIVC
jgi:hypothetical protein